MTIVWEELQGELNQLIENAGTKTDSRLAEKVSAITRLTDEEIKEFFPDPTDVKHLANLMEIVKSAGDRNEKINQIINNSEKFAGIVLTLLSKFA